MGSRYQGRYQCSFHLQNYVQKIDEKKREGKQNSQSHVYVYLEATRPALDFKIKLSFF